MYKAEDLKLGRLVALKFLADKALQVEELNKRFLREAQAAAKLDHTNICTVYGLEEADGKRFLVMAYLEGESLHDRLRGGNVSLGEAVDIAIQVAQGLQEAHERNIIHRDIKPANIFLTRKGVVKVTDFGLAFLSDRSRITKAGSTLGTVNYMSPEQFVSGAVDRRADVWSLGVVLYEMICGALPFHAGDMQSALRLILNAQPKPAAKVRKDCPPDLERVIGKALSKDREERYQHIDDMVVDLRAVRDKLPAEERLPSQTRIRAVSESRPDAPTETVTFDTPYPQQATAEVPSKPDDGQGNARWLVLFGLLVLIGVLIGWWRFLRG